MDDAMELHQIIYSLLAAQIEFGAYRYKDPLPKMEDASRWFSVSLDTVRCAYLQLKQNGYITLTKKAGAAVAVQFQEPEQERHIQTFFSLRRDAVIDLCQSLGPLFSHTQWFALKNAGPERLDELERLCTQSETMLPYVMVQHIRLIYGTLNNDLFLRLVWQAFLFYQAPFLSLPENLAAFEDGEGPLLEMISLCRQRDWDGLWHTVASYQEQLTSAISQFYANRITLDPPEEPIFFRWGAYENTSQRCYSLAMDLLNEIHAGLYKRNDFLPSPATIAQEKRISISTVRRTLALLHQLGATRSVNGIGTKVLRTDVSAGNCDFTQPVIRKRLLDFAQSLQILVLTCGACMENTLAALGTSAVEWWENRLKAIKESRRYESVVFESLTVIPQFSPIRAVREIYGQLLQILIWGYPLRGLHGTRDEINKFYLPYIDALAKRLERRDRAGLAAEMENLLAYELQFAVARLDELGLQEASSLAIPKR